MRLPCVSGGSGGPDGVPSFEPHRRQQLRRHAHRAGIAGANSRVVLRRSQETRDDQLPHAQTRARRAILREDLRPDQRLGVPLRQVQAHSLQGHDLRPLRRRDHARESAPRAHGPYRARHARQPHLVSQRRSEPHRHFARHVAPPAREGHLLRGLRRDRSRRHHADKREVLSEQKYREARDKFGNASKPAWVPKPSASCCAI